ncbi:transposase-like protein [Streptomyces phaeogriseichromatogenes]|nr:transposase-like protein [Streptomyces murinus]
MVISLAVKGLTTGEVQAHLAEVYGAEVSRQTISTIIDKVLAGVAERQSSPPDPVCPVVFIDAIHVKIRDGAVANRPIYVALAVTTEGRREFLGLWAGDGGEGAKHWLHILTEIKDRGVNDVLLLVCDGLKGLPEAVETVWPRTVVQTCVVASAAELLPLCRPPGLGQDRQASEAGLHGADRGGRSGAVRGWSASWSPTPANTLPPRCCWICASSAT